MNFKLLTKKKHKSIRLISLISLIILTIFFCFYKLSTPPLEVWDEYIYSDVIKTTLNSSNFLIPKWPDRPFFDKPPLWFYSTMINVKVLGFNNFSLRLTSAIFGTGLILSIYYIGKKLFSHKAGLVSALVILGTQHLFIKHNEIFSTHSLRSADLDSMHLFFTVWAFYFFYKASVKISINKWSALGGIFTGLAFMAKGPFGLVPAISYVLFLLANLIKIKYSFKEALNSLAVTAFLILTITLPWHLYMYAHYGYEFIEEYLFYHLLERAGSAIEGHTGNILFYIKIIFRMDFFFSGVMLIASILYLSFKERKKLLTKYKHFGLLFCITLIFLLVSIAQTKLSWYIFPLYPFTALVIGAFFKQLLTKPTKMKIAIAAIILLTIAIQIIRNLILIISL